jgi:hypothetical protein
MWRSFMVLIRIDFEANNNLFGKVVEDNIIPN